MAMIDFDATKYIDRTGLNNFLGIKHELPDDKDWVILNVGRERGGKSSLAIIVAGIIDPTLTTNRIVFPTAELRYAIQKAGMYKVVIQDEGVETWLSADANSRDTKKMRKTFMQMGEKNLVVIINIPSYAEAAKFISRWRAHTILRVVARGKYYFYSANRVDEIRKQAATNKIIWPKPNFIGFWRKPPATEFWKEYKRKAHEHKFGRHGDNPKIIQAAMKMEKFKSETVDFHDLSKMVDVPIGTLRVWASTGVLKKRYGIKTIDSYKEKRIWLKDANRLKIQLYSNAVDNTTKEKGGENPW